MKDDAIETRIRFYANDASRDHTRAGAVLDEAKLIVLTQMTESHDPGDEDRS